MKYEVYRNLVPAYDKIYYIFRSHNCFIKRKDYRYYLTCGDIFIKPINATLIASLKYQMYFSICWYSKSSAKENKIEIQDFQIPVNCISEEKVCLMN